MVPVHHTDRVVDVQPASVVGDTWATEVVPRLPAALAVQVAQARPGLLARGGGAVALVCDPRPRLAPVTIGRGARRRLVLPLLAAVSDCGPWAPHAPSGPDPPPRATGAHVVRGTWPTRRALPGVWPGVSVKKTLTYGASRQTIVPSRS